MNDKESSLFNFWILPADAVPNFSNKGITHVLSIGERPDLSRFPKSVDAEHLQFDDVEEGHRNLPNSQQWVFPSRSHVEKIIEFGIDLHYDIVVRSRPINLIICCQAGISRSTAAALIILLSMGLDKGKLFQTIQDKVPNARPNTLMCSLADEVLKTSELLSGIAKTASRNYFDNIAWKCD